MAATSKERWTYCSLSTEEGGGSGNTDARGGGNTGAGSGGDTGVGGGGSGTDVVLPRK